MVPASFALLVLLSGLSRTATALESVLVLTSANFSQHITNNKHTLVEFYAPWCGHCKKLEPEYEKAASNLKLKSVPLAKVDATEEKDIASKYNVKGFPFMIWFEDGKEVTYDGGRTSDTIVEWVQSMTGVAITETMSPPAPSGEKPNVVLYAASILPGFEDAAKVNRRKAAWYFVKSPTGQKVELQHKGEEVMELTTGCGEKDKVTEFVVDNVLPLYGRMDGDTFDKYMEGGKGLIWSMFPITEGLADFAAVEAKHRPMMVEVARAFKKNYFTTITDIDKFKEAVDNMLSVSTFPAIALHKKAGDKKKYVYDGEMTTANIIKFVQDVEAGNLLPKLKSEPEPRAGDDTVTQVVGTTLERELFQETRDVLLEVYAPWCGHCKKLDPEYLKLAKKIKKEELNDLLLIAKIDGTANDSPIDSVDWTGFPTIYFAKAGSKEATLYEGERTAKGLWKYIKKHSSKAQEIQERIAKRKGAAKKGEEL